MSRTVLLFAPRLFALALPILCAGAAHANATPRLGIAVAPRELREDGAAPTATVRRRAEEAGARVVVRLQSTDARVIVPATLVLPAGAASVSFPVRIVNDSIINDSASSDGFRAFRIHVSGAGFSPAFTDLRIRDDDPFRVPSLSRVTVSRFASVGDNMVRLIFSGPISLRPVAGRTPFFGLSINGMRTRAVRIQAIGQQMVVIQLDRSFADGDDLTVAAYNLSDSAGLPLPDQIRVVKADVPLAFTFEVSPRTVSESAGANAMRGTIRLARAAQTDTAFLVGTGDRDGLPTVVQRQRRVVVRAGTSSVSFPIATIDNSTADSDQNVLISANLASRPSNFRLASVLVRDDERSSTPPSTRRS